MTTHPTCISCGMPMRSAAEHAAEDPARTYCKHCGRPDGSMKSYEEVLAGMVGFLQTTQGLDPAVAEKTARTMMASQPAWRDRS